MHLRVAPFRMLWTANAFSNLGDGLYQFALPVLAVSMTDSPALVSGVTVTLTLAWPLFGLHAGAIVDRFDRRRVLAGVSATRFAVLAVVTLALIGGWFSLPLLYLAAAVLGIGETLADTALTSIVPSVVEGDELERANSRIVAAQTVTNTFVGPPLAGALLGLGAVAVTALASALYVLTTGLLTLLRPTARPAPRATTPGAGQNGVTAGFRYLWGHPVLRPLTLFTASMNVWWAAFSALFVVYALAPGPMGLEPAGLGVLLTSMAVGGVAGSLATERLIRAIGARATLALDFVGTALLVGVPALTTHPVAVGLAIAGAGAGAAAWVVVVSSIRQRLTPDELLGRTYSASRLISWGVLPVGAAAAGVAAELVGIRPVFAVGAMLSLGLLALFLVLVPAGALAAAGADRGEETSHASPQPGSAGLTQ